MPLKYIENSGRNINSLSNLHRMACLTITHYWRIRSYRTRTNTLLPTTDYYFTNTLRKYAYTIKNSIQTLTSVARLALNPRSETEFYVGNRFFALCTSSVSKFLRSGTFCPYSVCLSVRLSVCPPGYYFSLLSMCFKNNILSSSHIAA